MIQVSFVPAEHAQGLWPQLQPYMEQAAEYTYGRYTADDILDSVIQYDHHLWIAFVGAEIKGFTVTRIAQYPRIKCLDMVFCAGDDGMDWKQPMLKMLQHWGHDSGCDRIECSGRVGWAKIFKDDGYKALWQVYELPVADTGLGE